MHKSTGGRTPLFRAVARALRQARFLEAHPEIGSLRGELPDLGAAARRGDPVARREFLKQAARIGVALPLAGSLLGRGAAAAMRAAAGAADPVAILGGGAAGLTAAYRLTKAGV